MTVWTIPPGIEHLLHVRVPTLTRYMGPRWLDEFFDTGRLRLASFESFRQHPDESLRDGEEGVVEISMTHPNSQGTFLMSIPRCYVLCATSNQFDPERVTWSTESGFRITNPIGFFNFIASHVPGFLAGHIGACDYTDDPDVMLKFKERFKSPDEHPDGPVGFFQEMKTLHERHAIPGLFSKATRFVAECEHRFIWFIDTDPEPEVFVTCPEALEFCERPKTS